MTTVVVREDGLEWSGNLRGTSQETSLLSVEAQSCVCQTPLF